MTYIIFMVIFVNVTNMTDEDFFLGLGVKL